MYDWGPQEHPEEHSEEKIAFEWYLDGDVQRDLAVLNLLPGCPAQNSRRFVDKSWSLPTSSEQPKQHPSLQALLQLPSSSPARLNNLSGQVHEQICPRAFPRWWAVYRSSLALQPVATVQTSHRDSCSSILQGTVA